jgi:uncharacterized protein
MNTKTILVTGGSGFIGSRLTKAFLALGYKVIVADMVPPRFTDEQLTFLKINLSTETLPTEYDGQIYAVVHLAGKNIFGRWTRVFKQEVYDTRINSTRHLVEAFASWQVKPSVFVSASAFGFYGDKGEELVHEGATSGADFLSKVCVDWEAEAEKASSLGVRVVSVRTAHVLGKGGLLAPLFVPFRFGVGAWIGSGMAWLPWVHIDDIVGIYVFAVKHDIRGPINTAAPGLVRQKEFMKEFGRAMHRVVLFSIPIFLLYLRYGELAYTFDNSTKMSSDKLVGAGFTYKHPTLERALADVVQSQ